MYNVDLNKNDRSRQMKIEQQTPGYGSDGTNDRFSYLQALFWLIIEGIIAFFNLSSNKISLISYTGGVSKPTSIRGFGDPVQAEGMLTFRSLAHETAIFDRPPFVDSRLRTRILT